MPVHVWRFISSAILDLSRRRGKVVTLDYIRTSKAVSLGEGYDLKSKGYHLWTKRYHLSTGTFGKKIPPQHGTFGKRSPQHGTFGKKIPPQHGTFGEKIPPQHGTLGERIP